MSRKRETRAVSAIRGTEPSIPDSSAADTRSRLRAAATRIRGGRPGGNHLRMAAAPAMLEAAWARVRRNAGVAGGDGISCQAFERGAPSYLSRLRRDLLSGDYAPGPVRRVEVVKEAGGTRPLAIPCVVDRVAQTAVAFTLGPLLEPDMSSASFGYRAGLGVADAVTRIAALRREGRNWVLESDIACFFESVPHCRLLDLMDLKVGDARISKLVASWLDRPADGKGLLQGSPLSPLLANIYLDEFDRLMDRSDGRLVRYGDDFVVLAKRKAEATAALERAARLLAERGLTPHPDKTRLASFDEGFWFLGHYFVEHLVLRDLKHQPEAAPPLWNTDASATSIERGTPPKRPSLKRVRGALLRGLAWRVHRL